MGAFAALAIALASVGIFGVLAFSVGQRTLEFGVRMALGARPRDVLQMVMTGGAGRLRWSELMIGLMRGHGLGNAIAFESLLFGVKPLDPITFSSGTGCAWTGSADGVRCPSVEGGASGPRNRAPARITYHPLILVLKSIYRKQ